MPQTIDNGENGNQYEFIMYPCMTYVLVLGTKQPVMLSHAPAHAKPSHSQAPPRRVSCSGLLVPDQADLRSLIRSRSILLSGSPSPPSPDFYLFITG